MQGRRALQTQAVNTNLPASPLPTRPPKELIHFTRYNHETWETEKFCPCEITLNCIEFVGCEQKSQDSFQKTCFSCPVFLTDFDQ